MGRPPPITDDRARPVPIFDLERMRGSPALTHPDTPARYAHTVTRQDSPNPGPRERPPRWRLRDPRVTASARDDRGRKVRLLDPARVKDSPALATPPNPAAAARLAWARAELGAGNLRTRVGLFLLLGWVPLPILDGYTAPPAVWLMVLPLWAALLWQLNRLIAPTGDARRTRRVAGMLASHGLCPTCAYGLADLAPEPDGCTVCPECGGAWRRRAVSPRGPSVPGSPRLRRTGWRGRLPRSLVKDDRREFHYAVRLDPESLLNLPWSEDQRHRLAAALDDACRASRAGRRGIAGFHFVVASIYLVLLGYTGRLAFLALGEWGLPAGGWEVVAWAVVMVVIAFPLVMAAMSLAAARHLLSRRGWRSFPKGYACLPRHAFCAACFSDLAGLAPEPDGCTVCPECGAAWRLVAATPEGPLGAP